MPLLNFLYNKYQINFKKINQDLIIWLYKDNKNYDSMMVYGTNIYNEFLSFIEKYELFYNKYSDDYSFYIYGDSTIDEFYDDLHVFVKRFEAFIF